MEELRKTVVNVQLHRFSHVLGKFTLYFPDFVSLYFHQSLANIDDVVNKIRLKIR